MRPLSVVVSRIGSKDALQVAATEHDHPSVRTVLTHRSANAFAFGARIGVLTMFTPSDRKTSSKGPENFESRSRIGTERPEAAPPPRGCGLVGSPMRSPGSW